ncbi:hypothetical protein CL621_04865 [archaeon]|nr:hypothetical protein [archaeon]|tara:strand:+ start:955 stop:1236 length:282 start_codon:yes stop_codon:yes gene_type:complete
MIKINKEISNSKRKIVRAIKEFNNQRTPEAKAKLILVNKKSFKIGFTGSFCRTCGFYDYFDDFKILLEETGLKIKITKMEEIDDGAIVRFMIN